MYRDVVDLPTTDHRWRCVLHGIGVVVVDVVVGVGIVVGVDVVVGVGGAGHVETVTTRRRY